MPEEKDEITPEVFTHLVDLAALQLNESEAQYLRRELNSQLSAIQELEAIKIEADVPPASHGVPYPPERKPELRKDDVREFPQAADIRGQAPQMEDSYLIVPDIPHTTLE